MDDISKEIHELLLRKQEKITSYKILSVRELEIKKKMEELQSEYYEASKVRAEAMREERNIDWKIAELKQKMAEIQAMENEKLKKIAEDQFYVDLAQEIADLCKQHGFSSIGKAHDYQHQDIIAIVGAYRKGKSGMLIANDMGLGKTMETAIALFILSILYRLDHDNKKPTILWLTKKSLMRSSPKEIRRWWENCKIVVPIESKNVKERSFMLDLYDAQGDIFLTNYEFVRTTPACATRKWDIVVIDEVHKLKGGANPGGPTAIFKACKDLLIASDFMMMLSGTPMVNRPEEMWSYLHVFNPAKFPTLKQFKRDFMDYKSIAGQFDMVVDANKVLNQALRGQMIRRSLGEVKLQVPELNGYGAEDFIELEMGPLQGKVYEQMRERFFIWLDGQENALTVGAVIAQLIRLRQISVWPNFRYEIKDEYGQKTGRFDKIEVNESTKIDEAVDIISQSDDQVVVFCTFNEPLAEIKRRCDAVGLRCETINGETKDTGKIEAEFQAGDIPVLCINSAMGEGLNLQKNPAEWPGGSSTGILLDRWWSPARNNQCVARIHRQGSTEPVFIHNLFSANSVDYFIQALNDKKNAAFASIMDDDSIRPAEEWKTLLKDMI